MTKAFEANPFMKNLITVATIIVGLLIFMFSIDFLTFSLTELNNEAANALFTATSNPFVGLFIGLLTTALIQSSSTISAMVVVLVASGNLSLAQAVPVIMGANIGTTLTSTLVAFGYVLKRKTFRKALSAGVLHDIFNIITVIILLPLEVYFGVLSQLAAWLTHWFVWEERTSMEGIGLNGFFLRPLSYELYIFLVLNYS